MSWDAVALMIVAMLVVWGGLTAAIINLNVRGGDVPDEEGLHRDL